MIRPMKLLCAKILPSAGFSVEDGRPAVLDVGELLRREARMVLRIAIEREPEDREHDREQPGEDEGGLPAVGGREPDHHRRGHRGADRRTRVEPARRDRPLARREPHGRGLRARRYGDRLGRPSRARKPAIDTQPVEKRVQRAGRAPDKGRDRIADARADEIGQIARDRLGEGIDELKGRDDVGILLGREVQLLLEDRGQDAQHVAVDVDDDRADQHQRQDPPPGPRNIAHRFPLTAWPVAFLARGLQIRSADETIEASGRAAALPPSALWALRHPLDRYI